LSIDRISRKSLELYTCRRGFWLVLKHSLDLNLFLMDLNNSEKLKIAKELFYTYVNGMDVVPDKSIVFNRVEQFKVGLYPTDEWTKSVHKQLEIAENKPKKKNKHANKATGKRKKSGSPSDDERSSADSDSETNEWEVVDSANVTENPSRYVIVRSGIEKYVGPNMYVKIFPDMIPCTSTMECLEQLVPALLETPEFEFV
jgi:hypothetical protein